MNTKHKTQYTKHLLTCFRSRLSTQNSILLKFIKIGIATIFLFISINSLYSQTVTNLNLPTEYGGTFIGKIIIANGYLFAYSGDGILICDAITKDFKQKISFINNTGKFNPIYFNEQMYVPDQTIMVYNEEINNKYVYAITPDLKLMTINTEGTTGDLQYWLQDISISTDPTVQSLLREELLSQNGRVILKYYKDNNNPKLMLLITGRDQYWCDPGNFHEHITIFGIFNIDYTEDPDNYLHAVPHYVERNAPASSGDIYGNQINNFEYVEQTNRLYLIRLGEKEYVDPVTGDVYDPYGIINIYEIISSGISLKNTINYENENGSHYFKTGKLLHIDQTGFHKIVLFPYRYWQGFVPSPKFIIIDCDDYGVQYAECPSRKITDAVYLNQNKDIILSYSPDNNEIPLTTNHNTSIAIYRYDDSPPSPNTPNFYLKQTFSNTTSITTSNYDLNFSQYLTKFDNSQVIVSKKDEIAAVSLNANSDYEYDLLIEGESNFYGNGAILGNMAYVVNSVKNGFEQLTNGPSGLSHTSTTETGYPAYHVTSNHDGSRKFFYNKLNSYDNGFYISNNGADPTYEASTSAIGDIVYNPFLDNFIVSRLNNSTAVLKVYKSNNSTQLITLSGYDNATEMFISPEGYLYVATGMNYDNTEKPEILVLDAKDENYTLINTITLENGFSFTDFSYYIADYEYNPIDGLTYLTIATQEQKMLPYNTEISCLYNDEVNPTPPGKIVVMNTTRVNEIDILDFPYKILCPNNEGAGFDSQFYGLILIAGDKLFGYQSTDTPLPSQQSELQVLNKKFIDITYCKKDDMIYGVCEVSVDGQPETRKFEVYRIYINESFNTLSCELLNDETFIVGDGQVSCILSNEYDGKIYIYRKVDSPKLGNGQVALYAFDPKNPVWEITNLGMSTYYPDYDHTHDPANFYCNNRITPYIDPYTSEIFIPNWAHSCLSKVGFTPNDQLVLDAGVNWISIPRLVEQNGAPEVDEVLLGNITPGGYVIQSSLDHLDGQTQSLITSYFDGFVWDDFTDGIQSRKGYKIDLNYPPPTPELDGVLDLHGTILSPYSTMNLYKNKESWVGYFIPEEQDVLDAIKDYEHNIYDIKHQDYYCYRGDITQGQSNPQPPTTPVEWHCDQLVHNIKYGDMLVIHADSDINTFKWNYSGNPPLPGTIVETEYYEYTETADYTPFIIELDSTENPIEMGAFVNDSCIGGCTLDSDDSLAIIRGYIDENLGDSVVFEEYFGTKSSQNNRISEYFVLNERYNIHEQRTIRTNENKPRYFISLKNKETVPDENRELTFKLFPNPTGNEVNAVYFLDTESTVAIAVFDNFGRYISTLYNNKQTSGSQVFTWYLKVNGKKLLPGIYLIRLTINDKAMNKKLVVQ